MLNTRTKFILHGGFKPHEKQENDSFFGEIIKSAPDNSKVLLVYFAANPDRISDYEKNDILQFEKNKGSKKLNFEIADENNFIEQVKSSDVIYLHGGRTVQLLEILNKFPDLKDYLGDKVMAADSAGVNSISLYSYSHNSGEVLKGIGLIPFKTICHYSEEKCQKEIDELNKFDNESEFLLLKEYQFLTL